MQHNPTDASDDEVGRSRRCYEVNMPQMALSGLSEIWLFKELGDIHWQMISNFVQRPSSAIEDAEGNRLYATFARLAVQVEPGLRGVDENERLEISSRLDRYGASYFFGEHSGSSHGATFSARTMTTFAKHGVKGENRSLRKGAPPLPNPDAVPSLDGFPQFDFGYGSFYPVDTQPTIFSCDYDIIPVHDINGVGLLYFAAYPSAFDQSLERMEGKGFLASHTTVYKDIRYLANADPDDTLFVQIHDRRTEADIVHHHGSIWRRSDDKRIAEVVSSKRLASRIVGD